MESLSCLLRAGNAIAPSPERMLRIHSRWPVASSLAVAPILGTQLG